MILTKHEERKKERLFHENEKLRIFVSSCSINYLYQVVFLSSLSKKCTEKGRMTFFFQKSNEKFWWFEKKHYLCTRNRERCTSNTR